MKLTVLCDNYTIIDRYLLGEPALSFYLEDGDQRILFDTGYSDVFLKNAQTLGIDLSRTPLIVLSHGHNDHTRGLSVLAENHLLKDTTILAHPAALWPKYVQHDDFKEDIGAPYTADALQKLCSLQLSAKPVSISENLWFLGEIPRYFSFEHTGVAHSFTIDRDAVLPDGLLDDTALVYTGSDGLTIITGCSHSGICNICKHAQETFHAPIARIIGGFHLFDVTERLHHTIDYLESLQLKELYPCHCVSLAAKIAMAQKLPVHEVGTGDIYTWE